jgi:hypothetical protein
MKIHHLDGSTDEQLLEQLQAVLNEVESGDIVHLTNEAYDQTIFLIQKIPINVMSEDFVFHYYERIPELSVTGYQIRHPRKNEEGKRIARLLNERIGEK